jgi:hypothetical protein
MAFFWGLVFWGWFGIIGGGWRGVKEKDRQFGVAGLFNL